jgi:hypothetical protein
MYFPHMKSHSARRNTVDETRLKRLRQCLQKKQDNYQNEKQISD